MRKEQARRKGKKQIAAKDKAAKLKRYKILKKKLNELPEYEVLTTMRELDQQCTV